MLIDSLVGGSPSHIKGRMQVELDELIKKNVVIKNHPSMEKQSILTMNIKIKFHLHLKRNTIFYNLIK